MMNHSTMNHSSMDHGPDPQMNHAGHNHHAMMIADFKKRFYVVLILTIPVLLLSPMIQQFMGVDWQFAGSPYILFALSTIIFIYGGMPFLKGLVSELKEKNPGMMTLIGFAISVAYPESAGAIATLKDENIKSILLTGDNSKVAKSVSETLGMNSFIAEVLPDQKLEKIKELQSKGEFVAMTGDGVNDAPALAQADVGIAVGSGSDIAAETAAIVLVNSNPKDIVSLILFGKATHRKMIQNLIWATGYNVVALPLAAGVLYHWGILLSPAAGAALMAVSTIVVAVNASRLKVK